MKPWHIFLLLPLVACASVTEPSEGPFEGRVREQPDGVLEERRIGTIAHYGDPVRIQLPSSVARGEDLQVKVTTYGGGCVTKGDTEVEVQGTSALVTPWDWEVVRLPPNGACTEELRIFEHTATLRFEEAGTARVQIRGRERPSGRIFTADRAVQVR